MDAPKTLQEAIIFYANPDNCHNTMVKMRWPDGVVKCPRCGSEKVIYLANARLWKCKEKHPRQKFSLKVGTIFEDSPLGLDKWLPVVWLVANCKNGVSSYEIHRDIGVTQKTAWFMLHRVRLAMQSPFGGMLSGEIEADESFIGGKARNMHADKRAAKLGYRRGAEGKTIVAAVLSRHGEVRAQVVTHRRKWQLQNLVIENVEDGSTLYTDALRSYSGMDKRYVHKVIDHAEAYVKGNVHTNGLENFWSLLKRSINGTYISVEPFHLFRYVDEQAFRYNNRRELKDADRFHKVLSQVVDRRVTYKELTGKVGETNV
jgi:transposase-like protein